MKCWQKLSYTDDPEDHDNKFELWHKGYIFCGYSTPAEDTAHFWTTPPTYLNYFNFKEAKDFPQDCPYKLEHLMTVNNETE